MEPYRPYVDGLVCEIMESGKDYSRLTTELKAKLLSVPVVEVGIQGRRSPLMVAVAQTHPPLYTNVLTESCVKSSIQNYN